MPPRSLVRAFLALYATLGFVILVQSIQTIVVAYHAATSEQDRAHALVLGGVEALAAFMFLIPRTMRIGAMTLLTIFGLALGLHALEGHPNLPLLVYGAAVLFVWVHGVRGYRWQAAAHAGFVSQRHR